MEAVTPVVMENFEFGKPGMSAKSSVITFSDYQGPKATNKYEFLSP